MSSRNDILKNRFRKLDEFDSQEEEIEYFKMVTMFTFLSEVQYELDRRSWTRKKLAEEIGVSGSYLSQLFRGDKVLNLKTMVKISLALNHNFDLKVTTGNFHHAFE